MPVDYSKFDDIVDSDDEKETEKKPKVTKTASDASSRLSKCENCGKNDLKLLKCRCKKAAYCSLECQRKDYKFHKRICSGSAPVAPLPKKPVRPKKSVSADKNESTDSDDSGNDEKEENEKPLTWYKHRETKLPPSNSGPSKLAEAPKPIAPTKPSQGSAWNTAGTWEERDVTKWVSDAVKATLDSTTFDFKEGQVSCTSTECNGDASVGIIRGKARRIMDLAITVNFTANVDTYAVKGKLMVNDFTHDSLKENVDVALEFTDKKAQPHQSLMTKAILGGHINANNTSSQYATIPVDAKETASFANLIVHHLRRDVLPKFLEL